MKLMYPENLKPSHQLKAF
uniref:Uncharacterized protein n=1 Tax=Anguilla anguilla TaxID=7936 RepID=A0A0E9S709_ANGAN